MEPSSKDIVLKMSTMSIPLSKKERHFYVVLYKGLAI